MVYYGNIYACVEHGEMVGKLVYETVSDVIIERLRTKIKEL